MVITKYVVKGNTWFDGTDVTDKAPAGVTENTFKVDAKAAYDVGYTPFELTTDGGCNWGWNVAKKAVTVTLTNSNVDATDTTVIGSVKVAKDEYLNVTKQLKVADSITAANKAIAKVKDAHAIGYYGGLSVSKDASWTIDQGDNVYLYTVNADGTFSASAFKFVDGKGWTLTAKEMPLTVVTNVKMATVAGTTTGTGTVATPSSGVLKLKKSDITLIKRGLYVTLELENGIAAESVKWSTSDSSVATVYNGNVTAIGKGICTIRAEYNGQVAECVVRCNLK